MPRADRVPLGVPALGVGERQPAHESRQLAVLAWPDQQVPVIGHQAVGQKSRARTFDRLEEYSAGLTRRLLATSQFVSAKDYLRALRARHLLQRDLEAVFERADALLTPGTVQMGERNVVASRQALRAAGIPIAAEAVGGQLGRTVRYTVGSGRVDIRSVGVDAIVL